MNLVPVRLCIGVTAAIVHYDFVCDSCKNTQTCMSQLRVRSTDLLPSFRIKSIKLNLQRLEEERLLVEKQESEDRAERK